MSTNSYKFNQVYDTDEDKMKKYDETKGEIIVKECTVTIGNAGGFTVEHQGSNLVLPPNAFLMGFVVVPSTVAGFTNIKFSYGSDASTVVSDITNVITRAQVGAGISVVSKLYQNATNRYIIGTTVGNASGSNKTILPKVLYTLY